MELGVHECLIQPRPGAVQHLAAARERPGVAGLLVVPVRPTIVDLEATGAAIDRLRSVTAAPVVAVLNGSAARGRDADDAEVALFRTWRRSLPGADRSARSVRSVAPHRPGRAGNGARPPKR